METTYRLNEFATRAWRTRARGARRVARQQALSRGVEEGADVVVIEDAKGIVVDTLEVTP